ncbi:hypothetical protein [Deinococcus sp. QL22]|uniref:hypothetical protein n=1 Tax=Deinococcus sp. QL22 TaxID=2939437 RepID=UPI002017E811|nr:hypothetical protein [Deinococcus sp. QL22]UQN10075.1 hypothetical protein M1R55_27110 [Deinococcus sp. QL22]
MAGGSLETVVAGLPTSTPLIQSTLASDTGFFYGGLEPGTDESYGTAAGYPLAVGGNIRHLLLFGLKNTTPWRDQDQALIRAVSRSLKLALERAEEVAELGRRTHQLDRARQQAEVLAVLGEALQWATTPEEVAGLALPRIGPEHVGGAPGRRPDSPAPALGRYARRHRQVHDAPRPEAE